mgnify:CR=1 FL=1
MRGPDGFGVQTDYWNGAEAAQKTFTHPLPAEVLDALRERFGPGAAVLDYGCGYGRTCAELAAAGFDATGADISGALLERGRAEHPDLRLLRFDGARVPLADASCDACLLLAVLTCIPEDAALGRTMAEVRRLLRPGGLLFVSDYPLQTDARNVARYAEFAAEFGVHGAFRTGQAVCRHFTEERLLELIGPGRILWRRRTRVTTMNGHASDIVQILAQPA